MIRYDLTVSHHDIQDQGVIHQSIIHHKVDHIKI